MVMSSSISSMVERSLFKDKDGGVGAHDSSITTTIIKHRFLSFLIWQSIPSTLLFLSIRPTPFPLLSFLFSFFSFHFSLLLFSASLFSLSSPQPHPAASLSDLLLVVARLLFISNSRPPPPDFKRRLRLSLCFVLFVSVSALSGCVALLSLCSSSSSALRGFAAGFFYGVYYVYKQRWVLHFPIIQRPPFFSFKMGLPSAIGQALKLSAAAYLFSSMLVFLLPSESKIQLTIRKFITTQLIFYIGNFIVFLCWESSHHIHQVLHTKRFIFAPPKGSAAAETNPSEHLLAALEESTEKSLLQYLAYLDLCMACERNVDTWRRAAFYEETGDTYKRVIAICLKPLEQLTLKLAARLESSSVDNPYQLSHQLRSPAEGYSDSSVSEAFYDSQQCAWCARIVASLTAHSRREDRFGVAQLSGSNAAVISTLMSALLAVETLLGKKTNLQSANYSMGPAGIKWAALSTGSRDTATNFGVKRRGSPLYAKAYSMADILKTSIYCIVSAFHDEMVNNEKTGLLEKDWISSGKPPYATHEILLQKLRLFLNFQAS